MALQSKEKVSSGPISRDNAILSKGGYQGPLNGGGVSNGGASRFWTCPSFFVLFCPFWDFPDFAGDFPDLLRDGPVIFPISPFPSFSAY